MIIGLTRFIVHGQGRTHSSTESLSSLTLRSPGACVPGGRRHTLDHAKAITPKSQQRSCQAWLVDDAGTMARRLRHLPKETAPQARAVHGCEDMPKVDITAITPEGFPSVAHFRWRNGDYAQETSALHRNGRAPGRARSGHGCFSGAGIPCTNPGCPEASEDQAATQKHRSMACAAAPEPGPQRQGRTLPRIPRATTRHTQ